MLKIDKTGQYFPAFLFFEEQYFDFFMESIVGTVNMMFSKTAHIIQLSIYVPDSTVSMMVWQKFSVIYTLPPY